jgi:peptide/nickel transport system permease protein
VSFGIVSVPPFLLGLLLVALLAIKFQIFPNTGWYRISEGIGKNLRYLVLPVLTLALGEAAVYGQLLRADMAATLQEDYVLAARARGLTNRHVLMREALRPSSFSFVTLAGVNLGRLIGGTVVVEQIFGLPGVGRAITQAIPAQDFPTLQGGVLLLAAVYLLINLAVDMSYGFLDPRVRRVTG